MKYSIIPAKDLQCGDVIFSNSEENPGVQFCGRAIGANPSSHPAYTEYTEWRVEVVADGDKEKGGHTTIIFHDNTQVGIARQDEFVEIDVASLLADL